MTSRPPALAVWLLERLCGNQALCGDIVEEYSNGRSQLWFWWQTLASIVVPRANAVWSMAGLVALFALGRHIAIPGVNSGALSALAAGTGGSFRAYDVLSGGNLAPVSVLALAIHPYTTAVIAVESGLWFVRRALGRTTGPSPDLVVRVARMLAIILAATQALGLTLFLERQTHVAGGLTLVANPGWAFRTVAVLLLTLATVALMRISDRLSTSRTANGLLLVFMAGLIVGLPTARAISSGVVLQLLLSTALVSLTARAYRRDLCASAR